MWQSIRLLVVLCCASLALIRQSLSSRLILTSMINKAIDMHAHVPTLSCASTAIKTVAILLVIYYTWPIYNKKWLYTLSYFRVCYNYITTPDSPHKLFCCMNITKPRFCCIVMTIIPFAWPIIQQKYFGHIYIS